MNGAYMSVDKKGSQQLFRVIADSYESWGLIITTNLKFSKRGSVFTEEQMAEANDWPIGSSWVFTVFEGESYRTKHALMKEH